MPSLSDVVVNPITTSGDDFDAGFESEVADVVDGPVGILI